MRQRVSYAEYLCAVAMTFARRHRPLWLSRKCRCGAELPCRATHLIPIRRDHWPGEEERTCREMADREAASRGPET